MARPDPIAGALVKAAFELHRLRLWHEVPPDAPFLVRVPGEEHPLVAVVLGHFGDDYGVVFSRGERAWADMAALMAKGPPSEAALASHWLLCVTMLALGEIPPLLRGVLDAAGFQARRENIAPFVFAKRAHEEPRNPSRHEMRVALAALRALIAAHEAGELQVKPLDKKRRRVLQIVVEGEGAAAAVRTEIVGWPSSGELHAAASSAEIAGSDEAPTRGLEETRIPSAFEEAESADAPKTLAEWKSADQRFTQRLVREVQETRALSPRALSRYFGSEQVAIEVFEELETLGPLPAVMEWLYADFHASAKSPTVLERLLKDPSTTPLDRALIEMRRNARVSIYRVDAAQPGESLEVEDVFDGRRFTIHDRALSGCDVEGLYMPMRVQALGEWHVMAIAGPSLTSVQIGPALELLEDLGVELSAEGLGKSSHLVGRLWEMVLERSSRPVTLANTDGDDLVWQTATFRMADAGAVARVLGKRKDLQHEEAEGAWVWSRRGVAKGMVGDSTILGRIEMLDDRLVLEVNSEERLARARKWIEKLPGVTFERATARELMDEDRPLDDELPGRPERMDPERVRALEEVTRKLVWQWLDQPVPALGGKTPREACKTAEGRKQVERLVRTMPDVLHPGGKWAPPREELLRELGLGR